MTALCIAGGAVVGGDGDPPTDVLVVDGAIVEVGPSLPVPDGAVVVSADGLLVAPGFIDLQLNGAHGIDITEEPERLWEVAALLPRYGVTGFLPTIVTSPPEVVERAMAALAARPAGFVGAEPLGLHLEGPMLNSDRRGAHAGSLLRQPEPSLISGWSRQAGVALVTLAPELPGVLPIIEQLVGSGVVVSAGHTAASVSELSAAVDAGVSYITHLFNAMAPFSHRAPGPVGVALADERLTVGLIADGIHVHPTAVAVAWRALGPDRLNLVSDAVAVLGLPAGSSRLAGRDVTVGEGGVRLADGTLAGSSTALDGAVRNLVAFTDCSVSEALGTVTSTPARVVGLARKGVVAPGFDADLVLLTRDLEVVATIVVGREVHGAEEVVSWRS